MPSLGRSPLANSSDAGRPLQNGTAPNWFRGLHLGALTELLARLSRSFGKPAMGAALGTPVGAPSLEQGGGFAGEADQPDHQNHRRKRQDGQGRQDNGQGAGSNFRFRQVDPE